MGESSGTATGNLPRGAEASTLAIIAGGKSTRLGGFPKGQLLRDGVPVLAHLLALRDLFEEVLLVANDPSPYAAYGLRSTADLVPGKGAPGGVYTALRAARTPWVVAVACDMPFVSRAVVEALLAERSEAIDAACFECEGRLEPLLALYRTQVADDWERALALNPPFRRILDGLRTRVLPEAALRAVAPDLMAVRSVNTPEEARALGIGVGARGAKE